MASAKARTTTAWATESGVAHGKRSAIESKAGPQFSPLFLLALERVPGTPYLAAWANPGKSGRARRERSLRLMAIRKAGLESLALSASGREIMVYGWAAASED
jgi:hypothetical protein